MLLPPVTLAQFSVGSCLLLSVHSSGMSCEGFALTFHLPLDFPEGALGHAEAVWLFCAGRFMPSHLADSGFGVTARKAFHTPTLQRSSGRFLV